LASRKLKIKVKKEDKKPLLRFRGEVFYLVYLKKNIFLVYYAKFCKNYLDEKLFIMSNKLKDKRILKILVSNAFLRA